MDYTRLTAPCGIDCFNCQLFKGNAESSERQSVNELYPQLKNVFCQGCRDQGGCVIMQGPCSTRECAMDKGITLCSECSDFPCNMLNPAADQAQRYPHNLKVFNLCRIKAVGIEKWATEESRSIRDRYFRGTFKIGSGPQCDDPEQKGSSD